MINTENQSPYISYPGNHSSSPQEELNFETPESSEIKSGLSQRLNELAAAQSPTPKPFVGDTNVPYRNMWEQNGGYCGESSFIGAGMFYGQYCSQYDVRALANGSYGKSKADQQDMTIIGDNDTTALKAMHLSYTEWNQKDGDSQDFLNWVKEMVTAGYAVSIGVYMNSSIFQQDDEDDDYDHIVTVTGITTKVINGKSEDCLVFSDESLYSKLNGDMSSIGTPPIPGVTNGPDGGPYTFTIPFSELLQTRKSADSPDAPIFSLNKNGDVSGVAITGIQDPNHETVPVSVTSNSDSEGPEIKDGSNTRPASQPTTLTVNVSDLEPGKTYNLYMYNSFDKVPNSDFNKNAANAAEKWTVTVDEDGTITYTAPDGTTSNTLNVSIQSSDMAIFRCTPA